TMKRGACGPRCGTRARLAAEASLPEPGIVGRVPIRSGRRADYSRVVFVISEQARQTRRYLPPEPFCRCSSRFMPLHWPFEPPSEPIKHCRKCENSFTQTD